jgi:hypothetical protein
VGLGVALGLVQQRTAANRRQNPTRKANAGRRLRQCACQNVKKVFASGMLFLLRGIIGRNN